MECRGSPPVLFAVYFPKAAKSLTVKERGSGKQTRCWVSILKWSIQSATAGVNRLPRRWTAAVEFLEAALPETHGVCHQPATAATHPAQTLAVPQPTKRLSRRDVRSTYCTLWGYHGGLLQRHR